MLKKNGALLRCYTGYIIWVCAIFYSSLLFAQQTAPELLFNHLGLENGLSDPTIRDLYVDKHNFLWIGTENGLNRFDGIHCISYRGQNEEGQTLPGNYITKIIETKNGDLIIGSQSNLVQYNKKTNDFTAFDFSQHPNLKSNYYSFPFFIDNQDDLWVYLAGNVYRYRTSSKKLSYVTTYSNGYQFSPTTFYKPLKWFLSRGVKGIYLNPVSDSTDLMVKPFLMEEKKAGDLLCYINDVYIVSDRLMWLAGDKGLIKLSPATNSHQTFGFFNNHKINATTVVKYPGKPWLIVGTNGMGILLFDLERECFFAQYRHLAGDHFSLSGDFIHKLHVDKRNNLFIGVDGHGLDYTNLSQVIFERTASKDELQHLGAENDVISVLKFNNQVWYGTKRSGLLIYSGKTLIKQEFKGLGINKILQLSPNRVLIELSSGAYFLYDAKLKTYQALKTNFPIGFPGQVLVHQLTFIGAELFAATEFGLFSIELKNNGIYFSPQTDVNTEIPWRNIQYFLKLPDGHYLVQNYYTGIYLFSRNDQGFKMIRKLSNSPYGTNGHLFQGQYLYLATSAGLLRFNLATLQQDPKIYCLANCKSIQNDADGNIWLGTNTGLFRYQPKKNTLVAYRTSDGLQDMVFNSGAVAKLDKNTFAFGGINGVNLVHGDKNIRVKISSKPVITELLINDSVMKRMGNPIMLKVLQLNHNENTVSFGFNAMDYVDPLKRKMSYRMVGYDNHFIHVAGDAKVRYPNMPAGRYRFEIRDDESNEITFLNVVVNAPFWQKWWFILSLAFGVILLAIIGFLLYLRLIKKRQDLQLRQVINFQKADRKRIADNLHDELGLKLSSLKHYFLAGDINTMIDRGELRKLSSTYIDEAIVSLRSTLVNLSPKALDENGLLQALKELCDNINRMGIVAIQLDHNSMDVNLKSSQEYSLYRISQELINNTLKHAAAQNIYISLVHRNEQIIFLYEDDGQGFDPDKASRGYGLSNIEAHVQAIRAEFDLDSAPGRGLAVTIRLKQYTK